ncbi:hypothetical protein I546_2873 [Mycobacterium kansasii 732]|nr:hypothetical protein I546_2873 [Mycobacterium kansasii 732]
MATGAGHHRHRIETQTRWDIEKSAHNPAAYHVVDTRGHNQPAPHPPANPRPPQPLINTRSNAGQGPGVADTSRGQISWLHIPTRR